MITSNSSFQAHTVDQIGPLYQWLVVVDDTLKVKTLAQILRVSDRVTILSPSTVDNIKSDAHTFLLTKIDLLRPVLAGEWKSEFGNWTFYSPQIFPEFRGLFGRNFLVGTLPVIISVVLHVKQSPFHKELSVNNSSFINHF